MLTPAGAMKWNSLRPTETTYDFGEADTLVSFAEANDMTVRGHTLVWHMSVPEWFSPWTYSDRRLRGLLREHIRTVVAHYRDRVAAWDVVNEAIDVDREGNWRDTFWYRSLGSEYVDRAFEWAREVDPEAELFYNDYGAEDLGEKSDAVYGLVSDLVDRGVPIDGVGLQLHAVRDHPDPDEVRANIERLRELGLSVHVTEMDVAYPIGAVPDDEYEVQATYYRDIVEACLAAGCETIVTWGVDDGHSWIRRFKDFADSYTDDPLLFDEHYDPKPAYYAVREGIEETEP